MADWIFEGNPQHYDLTAAVASSRYQWWGTPHFRDEMAVGDRVWLQVVGPHDPGIYYVATITSPTYEHAVAASEPRHFRWRTDIRFDYRVRPPLLRTELEADALLGTFRPFRGFEGSNVPVPADIAAALSARVASRLEPLGLGGVTGRRPALLAWCQSSVAGMTTTGQRACWVTWVLTEPSSSRLKPPAPREPTTSMSASAAALRSASAGSATTARTVTDDGRDSGPTFSSALLVSSCAILRACSPRS